MLRRVTVVPHYGRDYKSKAEVAKAYNAKQDFKVQDVSSQWNGAAVNKDDAEKASLDLQIRYDRLTKMVAVSDFPDEAVMASVEDFLKTWRILADMDIPEVDGKWSKKSIKDLELIKRDAEMFVAGAEAMLRALK
jgi:hypothetical protein